MSRRRYPPNALRIIGLDDRIPPALYVAVAELLAWIYRLEQGGEALQEPAPG